MNIEDYDTLNVFIGSVDSLLQAVNYIVATGAASSLNRLATNVEVTITSAQQALDNNRPKEII